MIRKILPFLLVSVLMAGLLPVGANAITISAIDRGWWRSDDMSNNTNSLGNTFTGKSAPFFFRSYFVFDLSGLTTPITVGTLDLELNAYLGDASETIKVYDYTGSITGLRTATNLAGTFDDLGSGSLYGSAVITISDVGTLISWNLSAAAITGINSAAGGLFALGLSSQTSNNNFTNDGVRFTSEDETNQLSLNSVPEPSIMLLLGSGLAGLGLFGRRRKSV